MYDLGLLGMNNLRLCLDLDAIYKKEQDVKLKLAEASNFKIETDTVLMESLYSCIIEGSRTTLNAVKGCIDTPRTHSEKMVVNTHKALSMAYSGFNLSHNSLRTLWETVVRDVCENERLRGTLYRSGEVTVSNDATGEIIHVPTKHTEIEMYMESLFAFEQGSNLSTLLKATVLHFYFVYIHPFCDGNGRTARILMNYCLFNGGYTGVSKIQISKAITNHLGRYYSLLKEAEKPKRDGDSGVICLDLTDFVSYLLDMILEACILSEKKQNRLTTDELLILQKMSKKGLGAELTVVNASKILKADIDKSRKILNKLTSLGYLLKTKEKNKNIYVLKVLI